MLDEETGNLKRVAETFATVALKSNGERHLPKGRQQFYNGAQQAALAFLAARNGERTALVIVHLVTSFEQDYHELSQDQVVFLFPATETRQAFTYPTALDRISRGGGIRNSLVVFNNYLRRPDFYILETEADFRVRTQSEITQVDYLYDRTEKQSRRNELLLLRASLSDRRFTPVPRRIPAGTTV